MVDAVAGSEVSVLGEVMEGEREAANAETRGGAIDREDFGWDDKMGVHHVLREASDGDVPDGVLDDHGFVGNGFGFTAFGV